MSTKASSTAAVALGLILLVAAWSSAVAQGVETEVVPDRPRQRSGAPDGPHEADIALIDSPTPICYRRELESDDCFVNWGSIDVSTTSPRTIVSMTLTIDGQMRANYQGYFQSSMVISAALHGDGFRVPCGLAGVDGIPRMGHTYDWSLNALDSEGLGATNNGTLICPATDSIQIYLPAVLRDAVDGP